MTKQYSIIHLNGFMYMVDKEAESDWIVEPKHHLVKQVSTLPSKLIAYVKNGWLPIIASSDPSLNLPLLPNIEEDVDNHLFKHNDIYLSDIAIQETRKWFPSLQGAFFDAARMMFKEGFKFGYKAASAKKYTEEDMRNILDSYISGKLLEGSKKGEGFSDMINNYLQSLNPLPIAVEVECDWEFAPPKVHTLTEYTPQGPIERNIGADGINPQTHPKIYKPKVVNNIIQVKQWIYE